VGYLEVNHSSEAEGMLKDYYIGELDVSHIVSSLLFRFIADPVSSLLLPLPSLDLLEAIDRLTGAGDGICCQLSLFLFVPWSSPVNTKNNQNQQSRLAFFFFSFLSFF